MMLNGAPTCPKHISAPGSARWWVAVSTALSQAVQVLKKNVEKCMATRLVWS